MKILTNVDGLEQGGRHFDSSISSILSVRGAALGRQSADGAASTSHRHEPTVAPARLGRSRPQRGAVPGALPVALFPSFFSFSPFIFFFWALPLALRRLNPMKKNADRQTWRGDSSRLYGRLRWRESAHFCSIFRDGHLQDVNTFAPLKPQKASKTSTNVFDC